MRHDSKVWVVSVIFALGLMLGISPNVLAAGGGKQPAHSEAQGPIEAAVAAIEKGNSRNAVCKMHCTPGACSGVDPFRRPLKGLNEHKLQLAKAVGTACAAICDSRQVYNCTASFKKAFQVDPADPDALKAAMQPVVQENHQTKHLMCSAGILGPTPKYEDMIEALCR